MEKKELLQQIGFNVIQGRVTAGDEGFDDGLEGQPAVTELAMKAMEIGIDPKAIVLDGLTRPMEVVGEKFDEGTYLIPDMLASAECVGAAMDIVKPHLQQGDLESKGKFVIATVAGDLHDIGKNIVSIMLKGAGYEVVDLGTDVTSDRIVESVKEHQARFLGLSALLTTTMRVMGETIEKLKQAGLRDTVRILIGGAPTSQAFADQIGADAYCKNAFEAIAALKTLTA